MGYRRSDLSAKIDLAWEAARNELAIRAIAFGGAGMGKLEAKGTLGNVTKDLFSSDLALAQVAALGRGERELTSQICEGGKRQVRRMAEAIGNEAESLSRIRIGSLGLCELRRGEARRLGEGEVGALWKDSAP